MGRSVIPHPDATVTAYFTFDPSHYCGECEDWSYAGEECEHAPSSCPWGCDHSEEWREMLSYLSERCTELWPSFSDVDSREVSRWSENYAIAENRHSEVSVSEYCGLVALSLAPRLDLYYPESVQAETIGARWRSQISSRFLAEFGEYTKLGTASNGESFYQKESV